MPYRAPVYSAFFRIFACRLTSEQAHRAVGVILRAVAVIPGAVWLLDRLLSPRDPALATRAFGRQLRSPLGIAAGLDKDATWFEPVAALGFGSVEVGTATARAQPGNPARPRITRLVKERALVNAMGFPNPGSSALARKLARRRRRPGLVIGANIGKSKDVELSDAVTDYRRSARELAPYADYLALNVSSPNTPGLRRMQSVERLAELIDAVREEMRSVGVERPVLIKLGADLEDAEIAAIAELAAEREIAGIIAVNTTTDPSVLGPAAAEFGRQGHGGGISGPPLRNRSVEVLAILRSITAGKVTLVSVGGLESHRDAWERILAGASVVQAYTGLIYGGPMWPTRINRGLARCVRDSPWASIQEAVGMGAEPDPG